MNPLDACYVRLLHVGFMVLRQATDSNDRSWLDAELEFLHNVPSLIGELNMARHKYFWNQERNHYITWVERHESANVKSRMRTFYEPVLQEMEPIIKELMRE